MTGLNSLKSSSKIISLQVNICQLSNLVLKIHGPCGNDSLEYMQMAID